MFFQLPPAGQRVHLRATDSAERYLAHYFAPYHPVFFASGRDALAAVIAAVVSASEKERPEVLLPAYSCPHLVSAVLFAGANPVLVDMIADRPWMDLDEVAKKLSPRCVAVIAVHLFGIAERVLELREITKKAGVVLIEDGAQRYPDAGNVADPCGDYLVMSFGRGKPVSVLEGGAVLMRSKSAYDRFLCPHVTRGSSLETVRYLAKVLLYNVLRSPWLYWLPANLPFLRLGETRFEPVDAITGMRPTALKYLPANLESDRERTIAVQKALAAMIARLPQSRLVDLPRVCNGAQMQRLLRYPILLETQQLRDRLYSALDGAGLGASKMYGNTLINVPDMPRVFFVNAECPSAERFAQWLLTLPIHDGVSDRDIAAMEALFRKVLV